jgi:hypothetical protein
LQRLQVAAPADHFTLGWLLGRLRRRSFDIIRLRFTRKAIAVVDAYQAKGN